MTGTDMEIRERPRRLRERLRHPLIWLPRWLRKVVYLCIATILLSITGGTAHYVLRGQFDPLRMLEIIVGAIPAMFGVGM